MTVRTLQDPLGKSPYLFVLCGARQILNLSSCIKTVGAKYGLTLPSASRVRKIGATQVALQLGDSAKVNLVTRQMSHSVNTVAQYYQAIVGNQHATTAYETMTRLRKDSHSVSDGNIGASTDCSDTPHRAVQQHRAYTREEESII